MWSQVCRPSVVNFHILDFFSETTEQNLMKLDRKQELNILYQVCVFFWPIKKKKKKNGRPGLWLAETFSTSPLKPLNGIRQNLTRSKDFASSTKFVFFGPIEKKDGCLGLWLTETFSTSSLQPLNWIRWNFTESKNSTSSTKFLWRQLLGWLENNMAALASDLLRIWGLFLWACWMEFDETWQEASTQRPLSIFCFYDKTKVTALAYP